MSVTVQLKNKNRADVAQEAGAALTLTETTSLEMPVTSTRDAVGASPLMNVITKTSESIGTVVYQGTTDSCKLKVPAVSCETFTAAISVEKFVEVLGSAREPLSATVFHIRLAHGLPPIVKAADFGVKKSLSSIEARVELSRTHDRDRLRRERRKLMRESSHGIEVSRLMVARCFQE